MTPGSPDPTIYLNGEFMPKSQASLSIEDRGTLFGDGVYEVVRYHQGQAIEPTGHTRRLQRSLDGIKIALAQGQSVDDLARISDELIARNDMAEAACYWQITRGVAPRAHPLPDPAPSPTVLMIPYVCSAPCSPDAAPPTSCAITAEDERWSHCWIKSLNLLPNCLTKTQAVRAGCQDAILHRQGVVTEGTVSTALIVVGDTLIARPEDQWVLPGVTRRVVVELARDLGIPVEERLFTVDELRQAQEVMLVSTTISLVAITAVDDQAIAKGQVGPVTARLHQAYAQRVVESCAQPGRVA